MTEKENKEQLNRNKFSCLQSNVICQGTNNTQWGKNSLQQFMQRKLDFNMRKNEVGPRSHNKYKINNEETKQKIPNNITPSRKQRKPLDHLFCSDFENMLIELSSI
jgi:hypothetical protein